MQVSSSSSPGVTLLCREEGEEEVAWLLDFTIHLNTLLGVLISVVQLKHRSWVGVVYTFNPSTRR